MSPTRSCAEVCAEMEGGAAWQRWRQPATKHRNERTRKSCLVCNNTLRASLFDIGDAMAGVFLLIVLTKTKIYTII